MNSKSTTMAQEDQLKLALAKMLPDDIAVYPSVVEGCPALFCWKSPGKRQVFDTEWLHVCRLVEQTLDTSIAESGLHEYHCVLAGLITAIIEFRFAISATWQQRAIALCRVKGIAVGLTNHSVGVEI